VRRIALLATAMVLAAAGCGEPADPQTQPETAESTEAATSEAASPSPSTEPTPALPIDDTPEDAADGDDYDACYDGECEVAVTASTVIEFDPATGVEALSIVEVGPELVVVGTHIGQIQAGPGGCNALNQVGFTLRSVAGDTAIVAFYPAVDCG
jgi:hypothetical protein